MEDQNDPDRAAVAGLLAQAAQGSSEAETLVFELRIETPTELKEVIAAGLDGIMADMHRRSRPGHALALRRMSAVHSDVVTLGILMISLQDLDTHLRGAAALTHMVHQTTMLSPGQSVELQNDGSPKITLTRKEHP